MVYNFTKDIMKRFLSIMGLAWNFFIFAMVLPPDNQKLLQDIKEKMIRKIGNPDTAEKWKNLPPIILNKDLTFEHVEDFSFFYLQNYDNSEETCNYVTAMYNACEEDLYKVEADLLPEKCYRKRLIKKEFENFFLQRKLQKSADTVKLQKKEINTLSTGVYCSTGFALLFAGLFIWKSFK